MKKRIQFKLNERIFAVEIKTENFVLNDEDISKAYDELAEQINKNNEKINNIFFECLELVCSECGLSLNDDEKEVGLCSSCEGDLALCIECGIKLNDDEKEFNLCNKCEGGLNG
jgi:hypothetical protein